MKGVKWRRQSNRLDGKLFTLRIRNAIQNWYLAIRRQQYQSLQDSMSEVSRHISSVADSLSSPLRDSLKTSIKCGVLTVEGGDISQYLVPTPPSLMKTTHALTKISTLGAVNGVTFLRRMPSSRMLMEPGEEGQVSDVEKRKNVVE